jgi:hypothetical protein
MRLTKSAFLLGSQCRKALWLHFHGATHGVIPAPLNTAAQFLIDQGREVGRLAQARFPGGIDLLSTVGFELEARARETTRLIGDGADALFEAVFAQGEAVCAVDILVRDDDGWLLHEVKSGTKVEDHHVLDAAFQYWVLARAGLDVRDVSITHVNNQYRRQGELDLDQLFTDESVLATVRDMQADVGAEIANLQTVLASGDIPDISIGPHCSSPHGCPYRSYCWSEIPERSVFDLVRGGKKCWELYRQGIITVKDIPATTKLSPAQWTQVTSEKSGEPHVDRAKIRTFLDGLTLPIWHIDFETYAPAIPEFDGVRPYQQLPFQWSAHRQDYHDEEITHYEFLADAGPDPREPFVASLLEAVDRAETVLVYNKSFEAGRLAELRDHFPQYADQLQGVIDRLIDLMVPFQKRWHYSPEMHGSYSIKAVLPALVPELSYSGMAIGDGATASAAFLGLRNETDPERIAEVRRRLLAYCRLDTLAMVKLLEKLRQVSRPSTPRLDTPPS